MPTCLSNGSFLTPLDGRLARCNQQNAGLRDATREPAFLFSHLWR